MSRVLERYMKIIVCIFILFILPICTFGHPGSVLLPEGCGSCHVGHGLSNEPMLDKVEEQFCYQCHGSHEQQSEMKSKGKLSPAARLDDIEREFSKPYRHPVEESGGHSPTEQLPMVSGARVSHVECVDCHNPHQRIKQGINRIDEVSGFTLSGQYVKKAEHEYEVCLKCHVDLLGGPDSEKDISKQFSVSMRSMHPVTRPAVGVLSPSTMLTGDVGNQMNCSDCHRSGEAGGPSGPHGSSYEYLLSGNYNTDINADESPLAYQFCYSCHDRNSLLDNESFPLHKEHIVGDPIKGIPGTSCYTCHASHGSKDNSFLIKFNREAVSGSGLTNQITYQSYGRNRGLCYLTCHGQSHDPARY